MKRIILIVLFVFITASAFSQENSPLAQFIGNKVEIHWSNKSNGSWDIKGELLEVLEKGIIVKSKNKTIFINYDYIVKIELD